MAETVVGRPAVAAPPLTLGTAGHIDHGKTALVAALTGVDTDRLPEERRRGISIDLGYARLELPSGRAVSVVDVPGHERFVRTMVAGATGIDLYLLTIAADDGVMPQTGEHVAAEDAGLHVDRSFTIRGAGTVVTGTLWSGSVGRGDEVELLPSGTQARVRGVQVHDQPVERAAAGQRVAVNLVGVDRREVARGDVLVARGGAVEPTYVVDAELELGDARHELAGGGRVQVHHGTRESPARVAALGGRFFQLRLERPLVAVAGDRLVIRRIAPPDTLGGGTI